MPQLLLLLLLRLPLDLMLCCRWIAVVCEGSLSGFRFSKVVVVVVALAVVAGVTRGVVVDCDVWDYGRIWGSCRSRNM
jgi:hypothetical protein